VIVLNDSTYCRTVAMILSMISLVTVSLLMNWLFKAGVSLWIPPGLTLLHYSSILEYFLYFEPGFLYARYAAFLYITKLCDSTTRVFYILVSCTVLYFLSLSSNVRSLEGLWHQIRKWRSLKGLDRVRKLRRYISLIDGCVQHHTIFRGKKLLVPLY
jgi:hypothetical protein